MKVTLKINGVLLDGVRRDLERPHRFAHERVGFLTAGVAATEDGLMLMVRNYLPVADDDYEKAHDVGARIESNAMRQAVQNAYRPASTLLHIHSHGGHGRPSFSSTDLKSAAEFVPGFFQSVPKMPHGLLVFSNSAATGILWLKAAARPVAIERFVRVDRPLSEQWSGPHELA